MPFSVYSTIFYLDLDFRCDLDLDLDPDLDLEYFGSVLMRLVSILASISALTVACTASEKDIILTNVLLI